MKIALWILSGVMAVVFVEYIVAAVVTDYEYDHEIQSYWDLSDKASTIQQKSEYLDQYVAALQSAHLAEYDAIWLKTPNNEMAQNLIALKSLQGRMHDIIHMDENSFQYQQAMQQITGQEQGDAKEMTDMFEGCWYLENHPMLWDWIGILSWLFVGILALGFGICACVIE